MRIAIIGTRGIPFWFFLGIWAAAVVRLEESSRVGQLEDRDGPAPPRDERHGLVR